MLNFISLLGQFSFGSRGNLTLSAFPVMKLESDFYEHLATLTIDNIYWSLPTDAEASKRQMWAIKLCAKVKL